MNASPTFIIDACAALHLSAVDIDDKPILVYLTEKERVRIPQIVLEEYRSNFSLDSPQSQEIYTSFLSCTDYSFNIEHCKDFVKARAKTKRISLQRNKGELQSVEFMLWLSRTTYEQLVFVTDDFAIYDWLSAASTIKHIGRVFTSFDLLLFLFSRRRLKVSRVLIEDKLRDLRSVFEDSQTSEESEPDRRLLETLKRLRELCWYEACSNRTSCEKQSCAN